MRGASNQVQAGTAAELGAFVELLEAVGAALWARGIEQWPPGLARRQRPQLVEYVEAGRLFVVRDGGALAGGCIATSLPSGLWPDRPPRAPYLTKLVVAPDAAGARLGERIASEAERWCAARGFARLRLDCWDLNPRLRRYYRELGYTELGTAVAGPYQARLFEKPLG